MQIILILFLFGSRPKAMEGKQVQSGVHPGVIAGIVCGILILVIAAVLVVGYR